MKWQEWKDLIISHYQARAGELGLDADKIVYGGEPQIGKGMNIFRQPLPAENGIVSGGAMAAGVISVTIIVTVEDNVNAIESLDEAMELAILATQRKPHGLKITGGIEQIYIQESNTREILNYCAMQVNMVGIYTIF